MFPLGTISWLQLWCSALRARGDAGELEVPVPVTRPDYGHGFDINELNRTFSSVLCGNQH